MALFHAAQAVPLDPGGDPVPLDLGGDPGGLPGSSHSSKCQGILIRRLGLNPHTLYTPLTLCISSMITHPPFSCVPPPTPFFPLHVPPPLLLSHTPLYHISSPSLPITPLQPPHTFHPSPTTLLVLHPSYFISSPELAPRLPLLHVPSFCHLQEENLKLIISHGLQCVVKSKLEEAEIIFTQTLHLPDFQRVPIKAFVYICLAIIANKRKKMG